MQPKNKLPKETEKLVELILNMTPEGMYQIENLRNLYPIPMPGKVWRMIFEQEINVYRTINYKKLG